MVLLDGGTFLMGGEDERVYPDDGGPVCEVTLDPFWTSPTAVTNTDFVAFVDATELRTEAERFGLCFVCAGLPLDDFPPTHGVAAAP